MTTPLDDGPHPDGPADRRALESYPEFFTYPARPDADHPRIPGARTTEPQDRQHPAETPAPEVENFVPRQSARPGAETTEPQGFWPSETAAPSAPQGWPAAERELIADHRSAAAPSPSPVPPGRSTGAQWATALDPETFAPQQAPITPGPISAQQPSAETAVPQGFWASSAEAAPSAPQSWPAAAQRDPIAESPAPQRNRAAAPTSRRAAPAAAAAPTATTPGRGRRRAKRSLAASLWPFQAFGRPAPQRSSTRIRSRSTSATVWRRLRADRAAVFGGYTIVILILLAVLAPAIDGLFGVDPNTPHPTLTDATFGPHGSFGGMSWSHPLGVDQRMGRDVMARLLTGARVSLLIAFGATLLSVALGAGLGVLSGYLGGRVDVAIMRVADVFLAFPLMLFALGLTGALSDEAFGLSGNGLRIAIMIFVMGFFNWPYIARIVRAEVLSLREREFVDAARAMGAGVRWVVWRELMPNLMAPILVYATLLIPANIIFEAGLSALGIGLDPPAASWGQMMTDAVATVYTDPAYLIVPGMAVFITVLAFNLFGDGLRDALDPTAQ